MTAARKPPTGPPPSAGVLAKYAQAYAREVGVSEGRVRAWIAYMIMAGVLERAAVGGDPRFIVKGGVALELRLRDRARATKDIDIVLQDTDADLARTLERALTGDAYQGFTFRRKGEPLLLENRTVNEELVTDYAGLREACESVFRTRHTHDWPPTLDVPPHWIEPFARLAGELDLPVSDAQPGMARVQAFVARIISA